MSATCDIVGAERATSTSCMRAPPDQNHRDPRTLPNTHDETDAPYGMNLSLDDSGVIAHVARTAKRSTSQTPARTRALTARRRRS